MIIFWGVVVAISICANLLFTVTKSLSARDSAHWRSVKPETQVMIMIDEWKLACTQCKGLSKIRKKIATNLKTFQVMHRVLLVKKYFQ